MGANAPRARQTEPHARPRAFWLWLAAVSVVGWSLTAHQVARLDAGGLDAVPVTLWIVFALVLAGELRPLVTPGTSDVNGIPVSTAFVFAVLVAHGLPAAVLVHTVATVLAETAKRRAWWRTTFNVGQYALSYGAAAVVLAAGGALGSLQDPGTLQGGELPWVAAAGVTYWVVNNTLVAVAIAWHDGTTLRQAFCEDLAYQVFSNGALLALAPLVVVAAERGPAFVPLLVLPLVAVYKNAQISLEKDHEATHDALTGLPNRLLLGQRVSRALEEGRRSGQPLALLLLDLDHFKEVNDTLGHHVGDSLLTEVAGRLRAAVPEHAVVARLGGDEFAVLLPAPTSREQAEAAADAVLRGLAETVHVGGLALDVGASIGVALHPEHGDDVDTLLQRADVALYLAKTTRNAAQVYDAGRDHHSASRLALLSDLRRGIDEGQLELAYQPKAEVGGTVVGVEALVRWRHPERGLVPPDAFIPAAEQSGLVRALTDEVLEQAVRQLASWRRQGLELQVSVNISQRDLQAPEFAGRLESLLVAYAVPADALALEVTEGMVMADPEAALSTLRRLAALGVTLSLDDFGTGWSSLAQLTRLPVREVKVDRSFVQRLDTGGAAVVRAVVEISRALDLRVVAEGVETAEAWTALAELGCDEVQGWHLARPMPAAEVPGWLDAHAAARTAAVPAPRRPLSASQRV